MTEIEDDILAAETSDATATAEPASRAAQPKTKPKTKQRRRRNKGDRAKTVPMVDPDSPGVLVAKPTHALPDVAKHPLLAAIDNLLEFVRQNCTLAVRRPAETMLEFGWRHAGCLTKDKFAEINSLDAAVGEQLRLAPSAASDKLPDRPDPEGKSGVRSPCLVHSHLAWRHSPEFKTLPREVVHPAMNDDNPPVRALPPDDYIPPKWFLLKQVEWLEVMGAFRLATESALQAQEAQASRK